MRALNIVLLLAVDAVLILAAGVAGVLAFATYHNILIW
jgi:hypothetical protein